MNMMIQTRTGNPIVDAVATLNITGNVIPEAWYHTIVNEKGKVNCLAIHILADIVYWYRPTENRDETTLSVTYTKKNPSVVDDAKKIFSGLGLSDKDLADTRIMI